MSGPQISFFGRVFDPVPSQDVNAFGIVTYGIRKGGWKKQVLKIREIYQRELKVHAEPKRAKKAIAGLKSQLPAITPSGWFTRRANDCLIEHSGILDADLDHLGEKLPLIRKKLEASRHVLVVFLSPSGDGLKVWFKVPPDAQTHLASFHAVEKHVLDLIGIQIDQSGKDLARLCYVSFDPDAYYNPDAIELELLPFPEKPKEEPGKSAQGNSQPDKTQIREMLAVIPKRPDYHDWIKVVAAVGDALSDGDAIEVLNEWSPEEKAGEYADKLRHRLSDVHIGTLIHLAKEHGWTPSIAPTRSKVVVQSSRQGGPVELLPPVPYVPPPLGLLPSVLQDYIHAAAESLYVDVSFILLPLLSASGSAVGNSRSIRLKRGFIQPPIIWTCPLGRTGIAIKSPSLDAGCFAMMEHEKELKRQNEQALEHYDEELAEWKSLSRKTKGPAPKCPALLTCLLDDLTLASLADALHFNPRGVLVKKDELSHWFSSFDQFTNAKGADVSRWLSLHTGVFFGLDRRTDRRSYRIFDPRVNITGVIQPKILGRLLTPDFFERGLPARFLFAYPPARQARFSEVTIPDKLCRRAREIFEELFLLQPGHDEHGEPCPLLLPLSPDALALYKAFYNECGETAIASGEREEAVWAKLSGYGARLALVGQLTRNAAASDPALRDPEKPTVAEETMRETCDFARWCGKEAERIYATLSESPEQREERKLVEFIMSRGWSVYEREVMQFFRPLKNDKEGTERALSALIKRGRGVWEVIDHAGGRGRPTRKFRLLQVSTSTQFGDLRGETGKSVDVDTGKPQEITPADPPDTEPVSEAKILQTSMEPTDKTVSVSSVGNPQGVFQKSEAAKTSAEQVPAAAQSASPLVL